MKVRNASIILDNMTRFGFWVFMRKSKLERMKIIQITRAKGIMRVMQIIKKKGKK